MQRDSWTQTPTGGIAAHDRRAVELSHVVSANLLAVKRAWLATHNRGETAQAGDEQRRFDLALALFAAILASSDQLRPGPLQRAAARVPATLALQLRKQGANYVQSLATVAKTLSDDRAELSEADFQILDRFASLVEQVAASAGTAPSP